MLAALLPAPAGAAPLIVDHRAGFCDAGLSLLGDAAIGAAPACPLILTTGAGYETGSAWSPARVPLGPTSVLRVSFVAEMRDGGLGPGSGMTLAWIAGPPELGGGQYGLGYQTIPSSVAVELDTYASTFADDPNDEHLGLNLDGSVDSVVTARAGVPLTGAPIHVWVDYHQADQRLEVRVSDGPARPEAADLAVDVDLAQRVGPDALLGFTAANGGGQDRDVHLVTSWLVEADDDTDADGVMDFEDACEGDDAAGDDDTDLLCDDLDPCPADPENDADADGVCGDAERCPGEDDALDADADGRPDCLDGPADPDGAPALADRAPADPEAPPGAGIVGCGCTHPPAGGSPALGLLLALAPLVHRVRRLRRG